MSDEVQLYDVVSRTKYSLEVNYITDLENASDSVITLDELSNMAARLRLQYSTRDGEYHRFYVMQDLITARLNEIKAELQANPKKKSLTVKTADDLLLVETLVAAEISASEFCKGLRRRGSSFMLHDTSANERRDRNITLWQVLVAAVTTKYKELTGLVLRIDHAVSNRPAALTLLRSIVDKPTDDEWRASHKRFRFEHLADVDVVILNQMWDDVESFEFVKPKTTTK